MTMTTEYARNEPTRETIDGTQGPLVLEFGAPWCGICRAAQPLIAQALDVFPQVAHLKIEDGSGRRLGRSFKIKLWPSLIFMRDGQEIARLVRPSNAQDIQSAIKQITEAG
ncbi:MAG TPA: thioredoxin family protein [Burkholderiaceae bacterium]|nr:thioredoxin family protein [Burkholderiaceae bacterium]